MEGYINDLKGSRLMLGCPMRYMEGSMLECLVKYMDVTEGFRAKLGNPVGYIDVT
jgi:hypothetical protein